MEFTFVIRNMRYMSKDSMSMGVVALRCVVLLTECHNSHKHSQTFQGIINMNRNGNSAIFFLYVCNDKKIKELFASTLNGIPASVRCVSSMIIVLNTKVA